MSDYKLPLINKIVLVVVSVLFPPAGFVALCMWLPEYIEDKQREKRDKKYPPEVIAKAEQKDMERFSRNNQDDCNCNCNCNSGGLSSQEYDDLCNVSGVYIW